MSLAKQAQYIDDPWEDDADVSFAKTKETEEISIDDEGLENLEEELEESEEPEGSIIEIEEEAEPVHVFTFSLPLIPGSELEEEDLDELVVDEPEDEIEVSERDKWDWASGGLKNFMSWLHSMMGAVPGHSGHDTAGIERAIAYLQMLDKSISKAVRSDIKNELDIAQIGEARKVIQDGIDRLEDRYERLQAGRKRNKKSELQETLVKEAQKISGVGKAVITVPLFISTIARVCINGMVSAGHDIEDIYKRQVEEYKLDKREQASLIQLLNDMGYPMRRDRGIVPGGDIDSTRSDNFDWAANYPA